MIRSVTHSRTALCAAIPAAGLAALVLACPAQAYTPASRGGSESTPLRLSAPAGTSHATSSGPSLVRTIVGLVIVIGVIWGLTWILRQVKSSRETRAVGLGLASMATLPLGSGRTLHLVRAGSDYLLVGSAEQGVVPISRYTEQEALDAGLLEPPATPVSPGTAIQPVGFAGAEDAPALIRRLRQWTVRK
jgi:flagellar protein FliO/FliZ